MNSNEILEVAKQLGMMLAESDEAKALKLAEERHMEDAKAQALMTNYSIRCEQLSEQANKEGITKEEYEKINLDAQAEFIKISQNETIKNYLEANENFSNSITNKNILNAFSNLINKVNGIIAHFVRGEDNSGCGGNCSGCSGCH